MAQFQKFFQLMTMATMACACLSCIACSINWSLYINDMFVKKTGQTDTTKAEMALAIIFSALMVWEIFGHFLFKMLSGG